MTDELSPAARALLDSARASTGPDAAAIARMRAKIDTAVVGGGATVATVATKLAVVGVVAAVAIGALVHRETRDPAVVAAPAIERSIETPRAPAAVAPIPTVVPSEPEPIEMPPASARDGKRMPVVKPIDLAREVELVDRAMAAMKRGDAALALAAVRLHVRETGGKGQLAEDAAAIEIEAMCRSQLPVTGKLAAFDARWPTSAQRARLATVCP